MKYSDKITLATATAFCAGCAAYLIQYAVRLRCERLYRLAAGESPYERSHPKAHSAGHS